MNKNQEVKGKEGKTLKEFLGEIPTQVNPRAVKTNELALLCRVSTQSLYNWMNGISKPRDQRVFRILSEATGLRQEDLFKDVGKGLKENGVEVTRVK